MNVDSPERNAERERLERQRAGTENWRLWGPYLAERAWGTVREDYSAEGTAWEHFDHEQARMRAYRWNEDGMGGICDEQQRLCFALALWNGKDRILKERAFGLTGNQGNHGEDVKEYYFYLDATPSHSFLRYLYKYPQAAYPYEKLVAENARRTRLDPPFGLIEAGVFEDGRYWDVEVCYAKESPTLIHIRINASNRGPERATLHLIPTLWFRNTWSWERVRVGRPRITEERPARDAAWAVTADHLTLGRYRLQGRQPAELLFTENETNFERLWGSTNASAYVKDAFHRFLIDHDETAVNPARTGTKFGACQVVTAGPGESVALDLVLSAEARETAFDRRERVFAERQAEASAFYAQLLPEANFEDRNLVRQALAGMIWGKQFYHYDVGRWLDGDLYPPPETRRRGRNRTWRHLRAAHVISMPDKWEYPWFAAWDLAFHCAALALVDVDFAKNQVELLLKENFLHPNGQIPAYEWALGDANPPVLAMAALKVFRAERVQRGKPDVHFLQRVMHKLLMHYTWWLNRKDADGHNVFEGGFLGLDNISVYDRSRPLPPGYSLKQADATGWMAMFALNMTVIALELAAENSDYEDVAIQCYMQFLGIAKTIAGQAGNGISLWDPAAGFFKDLVIAPDGRAQRIDVFSWVGIIPLFACEIVDQRLLRNAKRFQTMLLTEGGGLFKHAIGERPEQVNARGEHLLSLVDHTMLRRILRHLLSEDEFLSPHGIRSVSRVHAKRRDLGTIDGVGQALIEYVPGESTSELFGGNSNWRGPIWVPTNYMLIQALEKFQRYLGPTYTVAAPCVHDRELTLDDVAKLLSERLVNVLRRDSRGLLPAFAADSPFQRDPHWQGLLLFHEYYHGETGQGLGAMHQTGWTGLLANLVLRRYRTDIPVYWRKRMASITSASATQTVHALR